MKTNDVFANKWRESIFGDFMSTSFMGGPWAPN